MRSRIFLVLAILILAVSFIGCSGGAAPTNSNTTNTSNTNSSDPLATKMPAPELTTNAAPTLTPVYKAYCEALKKKDEAVLRKIYSSDTIKYFEGEMKADKVPSLIKYLESDGEGKICEIRNEQINGDSAVAEIRGDTYPNGIKVVFVKQNGEWKLTNKSSVLDPAKSTSTDANSAKKTDPATANTVGNKKDAKK